MLLKFTKMHGLGNDFIVIDAIRQDVTLSAEQIRFLADRHFGVGCDQVLLVEPPQSKDAEFRYRIFNNDGGEVEQCGNGARCFAQFVREQGLSDEDTMVVETQAGLIQLTTETHVHGNLTIGFGEQGCAAFRTTRPAVYGRARSEVLCFGGRWTASGYRRGVDG